LNENGTASRGAVDRYGQPLDGSPAIGELSPENSPYGATAGSSGSLAGRRSASGATGTGNGSSPFGSSREGSPGEAGSAGGDAGTDRLMADGAGGKSESAGGPSGASSSASGGDPGQSSNAQGNQISAGSGAACDVGQQPPAPGAPPIGMAASQGKRVKSMAQARGRDWGLPNAEPHAVAANRPLLVECHNDRLVIPAADRSEPPKEIRLGARTQDSMDDLVSGVWKHIEGWGMAGRGMYWKPELVMDVKPGAADRYAEIKGLLADSGLEVRERQPRPAARPAPRKTTTRR
jgi:hypothetical protein